MGVLPGSPTSSAWSSVPHLSSSLYWSLRPPLLQQYRATVHCEAGGSPLYTPTWMFAYSLDVFKKFPVSPGPHRTHTWDQRGVACEINLNNRQIALEFPFSKWQLIWQEWIPLLEEFLVLMLISFPSLRAKPTFSTWLQKYLDPTLNIRALSQGWAATKAICWGAWLAQSVQHATLNSRVVWPPCWV